MYVVVKTMQRAQEGVQTMVGHQRNRLAMGVGGRKTPVLVDGLRDADPENKEEAKQRTAHDPDWLRSRDTTVLAGPLHCAATLPFRLKSARRCSASCSCCAKSQSVVA